MLRRLLPLALLALAACADPAEPDAGGVDGGAVADAGQAPRDAGADEDAGRVGDTGDAEVDAGVEDAGLAGPDAAVQRCNAPFTLDGVVHDRLSGPRTLLPVSASPVVIPARAEASPALVAGLSRLVAPGAFAWHADVSLLATTGDMDHDRIVRDPADGAVYVVFEQQVQGDGMAFRVYHADGALAAELVRDGEPGRDLVGRSRQSNFIAVKYDASGQVQWVSRFGPNRSGTDRAGLLQGVGLTPTGLRVVAQVEGSTQLVFGPGSPSELTYSAPGAVAFWAELSKADGSYLSGSFQRIEATTGGAANLNAIGESAHDPGGETAFAGVLSQSSGTPTFTLGQGPSPISVTSTVSRAVFGKLDVTGRPAFATTAVHLGLRGGSPDPRAVGLSPLGHVVAGGQLSGSGSVARFYSAASQVDLPYQPQNSFLVAHTPAGEVAWVKRIASTGRNAVSRILVTDDAAYLLGSYGAADVLEPDGPNPTPIGVNAYALSKYALSTGELQWVRAFTSVNGQSATGPYEVWTSGGRLVLPLPFQRLRMVGGGVDLTFEALEPSMLAALLLEPTGALVECQAVAVPFGAFKPL